jgi:hypothetical protein
MTMRKKAKVCTDVDGLHKGDSFDWDNPSKSDCEITKCKPPLTQNSYHVPAGKSTPANVDPNAPLGTYPYECKCGQLRTTPKIIIGSD